MDSSIEGYQRKRKLQKELDDQDVVIADKNTDRNRKLLEENLKDSVAYKAKQVKTAEESLDKEFSLYNKKILAHEILVTESFDKIKKKFPELFEELGGQTITFFDTFKSYEEKFGSIITNFAKKFKDEILPMIKEAIIAMRSVESGVLEQRTAVKATKPYVAPKSNETSVYIGTGPFDANKNAEQNKAIQEAQDLTKSTEPISKYTKPEIDNARDKMRIGQLQRLYMASLDEADRASYASEAQSIREKNNWNYENLTQYTPPKDMIFAKGINNGLATKTGLYQLHGTNTDPEWIFTNTQMFNLVKGLATRLSPDMSQLPYTGDNNTDINLTINVMGNADTGTIQGIRDAGDQMLTTLRKELYKTGIYR